MKAADSHKNGKLLPP